jgi:hypothetical protein
MTDLRVDRLRIRGGPPELAGRLPAERLVAGLDLAPAGVADRSILVVRRLDLEARTRRGRVAESGLRRQAAERMAELRARAVRPVRAPDAADNALAVVFADEAELLACLTRDVVAGQLSRRWYWHGSLPAAADRGSALAVAWVARARWLPAAAGVLGPRERLAAVALLDPERARAVLAAVLADRGGWTSAPVTSDGVHRVDGDRGSPAPGPPRSLGPVGGRGTASPEDHQSAGPYAAWPGLATSAQALLLVLTTAVASPALLSDPDFRADVAAWAAEPAPDPALPATRTVAREGFPPVDDRAAAADRHPAYGDGPGSNVVDTAQGEETAEEPAEQPRDQPAADGPVDAAEIAPRVWSRCAGVLYLVNLWPVLDSGPGEDRPGRRVRRRACGWSRLELLGRALLTEEQAPADDPLWGCLAELDGRRPGARPRGRLPAGLAAWVADLLQQHGIERSALATPGWVAAGRTHVDVELDIEAIDLPVRVAGLDRDPGWVPELGRVVSFHFGATPFAAGA